MTPLTPTGPHAISAGLPARSALHPARKFFHCFTGIIFALACANLSTYTWTLTSFSLFLVSFTLEVIRVSAPSGRLNSLFMKTFSAFSRSSETHEISGTPYYMFGMFVASSLFSTTAATLGILCLACLDPVAAFAGSLAERDMPWARLNNGKSFVGFVFSACTGIAVSALTLSQAVTSTMSRRDALATGVFIGWTGALVELVVPTPRRVIGPKGLPITIDDNAIIPVVAAAMCDALMGLDYHHVQLSPILFWNLKVGR